MSEDKTKPPTVLDMAELQRMPPNAFNAIFGRPYRKTAFILARPLEKDDARDIALGRIALNNQQDRAEVMDFFDGKTNAVGVVATDPTNANDRWYIGAEFFARAYTEAVDEGDVIDLKIQGYIEQSIQGSYGGSD